MCPCSRCRVVARVARLRADPTAPLKAERWLVAHAEAWPWWALSGVLAALALLVLPLYVAALPLALASCSVAAVPSIRDELTACHRI